MIKLTEQDINYIVKECVNKIMLNESMTDITFHFTDYDGLKGIIETNTFKLSETDSTGTYYYMSFTSQKYGGIGYPYFKNLDVRIEIDGTKLNYNYKSKRYDYYHNPDSGMSSKEQEFLKNGGKLSYRRSRDESEERIYSKKPFILNADKYIKRIDILLDKEYIPISMESFIKSNLLERTFIYDDRNDFELQNKKCRKLTQNNTLDSYFGSISNTNNTFDSLLRLTDNLYKVSIGNKVNIINDKKEIVSKDLWFDDIDMINENLFKVKIENTNSYNSKYKFNFIDSNGNLLLGSKTNFYTWPDYIDEFIDGYAKVILNKKCNYIDENLNFMFGDYNDIKKWYDRIGDFNFGKAYVCINNKWNFIDKNGNILYADPNDIRTWFDDLEYGSEIKAKIKGKWYNIGRKSGRIYDEDTYEYFTIDRNGNALIK